MMKWPQHVRTSLSTVTEEEMELRYERFKPVRIPKLKPNYNFSPTQEAPVLRHGEGVQLDLLKWGLVPFWAKDVKIGYKMINARAETVTEKPAFRAAFTKRRCIVPLSGFIEWKRTDDAKRPFAIHLKTEPVMSLAGIWESWKPEGAKKALETFSILTTEANSFMAKIHDRMPVILDKDGEDAWMDEKADKEELVKLLKPCASKLLDAYGDLDRHQFAEEQRSRPFKAAHLAPKSESAKRTTPTGRSRSSSASGGDRRRTPRCRLHRLARARPRRRATREEDASAADICARPPSSARTRAPRPARARTGERRAGKSRKPR